LPKKKRSYFGNLFDWSGGGLLGPQNGGRMHRAEVLQIIIMMPEGPKPTEPTPTPEAVAAKLNVLQRVLLFCVASNTDWRKVGIANPTVQLAIIQNLIDRAETTSRLELTEHGRAVLAALLGA
jgi:hypothetical protein